MPRKYSRRVVFFPYIAGIEELSRNHKWKVDDDLECNLPQKFVSRLDDTTQHLYQKYREKIRKIEHDWQEIHKTLIKELSLYFKDIKNYKIYMIPSLYGTVGHYTFSNTDLYLRPRFDRDIAAACKLCITAFSEYLVYNNGNDTRLDRDIKMLSNRTWSKKIESGEEIYNELKKKLHLPETKSMVKILEQSTAAKFASESCVYLRKLNAPAVKTKISTFGFTREEKTALELLQRTPCCIVSYDAISQKIWGNEEVEKFSLYAINKLMQRIRYKLEKQGVEGNLIHVQRGKGYLLYL